MREIEVNQLPFPRELFRNKKTGKLKFPSFLNEDEDEESALNRL